VRYVNLGGGFGIPYFDKDTPLDLTAIGTNLAELIDNRILPYLPDADVAVELGRYIVGECGVYVTRIVDRKVSRGRTYLVVDGGMHHQLAASGNFGQVIRRNYPIAIGNRLAEQAESAVTVVGCLCTPLDLLGDDVRLPDAQIGDSIVLFQAGAYGLTASPTAFLGHPSPTEVIV
jgi:diaminopimelate decarboxylase